MACCHTWCSSGRWRLHCGWRWERNARDVLRMILKRGMTLAAIGVAAGLAISFLVTRFIATLLYNVKPLDALTFCAMSLVLLAVAFVRARRLHIARHRPIR